MTKKAKHNKKIHDRQNILDELLHFGSYMAVKDSKNGGDGTAGGRTSGKRRKIGKNGKFAKKSRHAAKGKKVRLLSYLRFCVFSERGEASQEIFGIS